MSGLLAVLPVLDPEIAEPCLSSMLEDGSAAGLDPSDILIVDNTRDGLPESWDLFGCLRYRDTDGHNLGVARSWNVGARGVLDRGLDYLVILSASLLWGPELHTTWRRQMEEFWGSKVIEADGHSWKLIALHRTCFEKIGLFDENYHPAYQEQTDWCYRLRMVGWEQGFVRVWCNVLSRGVGMHIPLVSCPADPLLRYYADKWGGPKGEETNVQPWGSKPLDYWPERTIPELAEEYGLEEWW